MCVMCFGRRVWLPVCERLNASCRLLCGVCVCVMVCDVSWSVGSCVFPFRWYLVCVCSRVLFVCVICVPCVVSDVYVVLVVCVLSAECVRRVVCVLCVLYVLSLL